MLPEKTLDLRTVKQLVIAGWTGRDVNALEAHIRELEAIGVRRPKSTPIFYRASASLLTSDDSIEVVGEHSSGEVEVVVFALDDGAWIGVGSDHTDRKLETTQVRIRGDSGESHHLQPGARTNARPRYLVLAVDDPQHQTLDTAIGDEQVGPGTQQQIRNAARAAWR